MSFKQLIRPNFNVSAQAGGCLIQAQQVVGAGGGPHSATSAANQTQFRHHDRDFPTDAIAVVWFSHIGTYWHYILKRYTTEDYGHVVITSPDAFGMGQRGFFSSPRRGEGGEWFRTIEDVEASFNSSYRFWSEDINGVRVCEPNSEEEEVTPEDIEKIAQRSAQLILDTKVPMQGTKKGKTKTLRQLIAWNDHQWASIKRPLEWLGRVGPLMAKKLGVK